MTRAAVTFTEIFIVLALIFIIQTVVNFNLFEGVTEGVVEDDVPDLVTLTITGNHLLYFRFQKQVVNTDRPYEQTLWLAPSGGIDSLNLGRWGGVRDVEWIIDRTGRCNDYRPVDVAHDQFESFREALKSQFGISVNVTYLDAGRERRRRARATARSFWPLRALFSWSPADLAEDAEFRIGEYLNSRFLWDDTSDGWYLRERPLPIITRVSYFGNRIVAQDPQELRFDPERFVVRRLSRRTQPFVGYLLVAPGREMNWHTDFRVAVGEETVSGSDYVGFMFGRFRSGEIFGNCRFANITGVRESLVSLGGEG